MVLAVLKAPRPSRIDSLHGVDGTQVSAGQLIAVLDSSPEEERIGRLKAHEEKLNAHLEILSDPKQRQARINYLKAQLDALTKRQNELLAVTQDTFNQYTLGHTDLLHVSSSYSDYHKSQYDRQVAEIRLSRYEPDNDYARRHLMLTMELVKQERLFAQRKVEQLSIKAPVDGTLALFADVYTPVRHGFIIGEIR